MNANGRDAGAPDSIGRTPSRRARRAPRSRLVGIIGGMSWESTAVYYRIMNQLVADRLGGLHSARILLHSVDFEPVERLQAEGDWEGAGEILGGIARTLVGAGAEILLLATNTMHIVAAEVESAAGIPLVHIADSTGEALVAAGVRTAGLLGTRFTMERDFYRGRLAERFGLDIVVPDEGDREIVHRIIYEELCRGIVEDDSRRLYVEVIDRLIARGAQGVILGCTEIPLLVRPGDTSVALFDTTRIHAGAAVEMAFEGIGEEGGPR
ncbi:MAG: aspartate/glutamate racemase family protein [Planctomycetes bacterium]|nr:aspartate/glutamate racemase family protein [Planctomycetota bacterium]